MFTLKFVVSFLSAITALSMNEHLSLENISHQGSAKDKVDNTFVLFELTKDQPWTVECTTLY